MGLGGLDFAEEMMKIFQDRKRLLLKEFLSHAETQLDVLHGEPHQLFTLHEIKAKFIKSFEGSDDELRRLVATVIAGATLKVGLPASSLPHIVYSDETVGTVYRSVLPSGVVNHVIDTLTTNPSAHVKREGGGWSEGFFSLFCYFARDISEYDFKYSYRDFLQMFYNSVKAEISFLEDAFGPSMKESPAYSTNLLSYRSARSGYRKTFDELYSTGLWQEGLTEGEITLVKEVSKYKRCIDQSLIREVNKPEGCDMISSYSLKKKGMIKENRDGSGSYSCAPFYQTISRINRNCNNCG